MTKSEETKALIEKYKGQLEDSRQELKTCNSSETPIICARINMIKDMIRDLEN